MGASRGASDARPGHDLRRGPHDHRAARAGPRSQPGQPVRQRDADASRVRNPDRQDPVLRIRAGHCAAGIHQHARARQVPDARGGHRMTAASELPSWAALGVAILVVAGTTMTLLGSIGLLRFRTFYERLHPPTLGSSSGTMLVVLASILYFSVVRSRPSIHEILILIFMTLTTPVTFILLARAALYRDRTEGNSDVPSDPLQGPADPS